MKFLLDGGASANQAGSNIWFWVVILVGIGLMFVMSFIRNKKDTQARNELNESLKVGTKVITYAGVYGTIISMRETTDGKVVVLETGDEKHKSYMEILANAIAAVDKKETVVLDENGNDITENYKEETVQEIVEEKSEEKDEVLDQIKSETVLEEEHKKPKKNKKK